MCARFPHNLANEVPWEAVSDGVYRCRRGTDVIRVVAAGELPRAAHNAPLHLFSAAAEQVAYGARHYRQRSAETSTLLYRLFRGYQTEGLAMPYTMEDFRRDVKKEFLQELTPEERREILERLSPEERLKGLPLEEIEAYLQRCRAAAASQAEPSPKSRKGRTKPKP